MGTEIWKVLMPIGLVYVMLIGLTIYLTDSLLPSPAARMGLLTVINLALGYLVFIVLDRGILITGSSSRTAPDRLSRAA